MNSLKLTSQFKKDLKRYKHKGEIISKLETILNLLIEGLPIPEENRPHASERLATLCPTGALFLTE